MARQEQQIKTKLLYFIKTYRYCGFSYKKKNRTKLSCRFVINSPFNGLPWWPSLWMNQEDLKILHQLPLLYRQPCWTCSMGASATWLDLCVCKSPEKVQVFFAHYWNRGRNFLQSYSVADLRIRILLVLFMHFSREMNWVCFLCVFFFKYFPFCMHGGHNLMPKCNVEKRHWVSNAFVCI